jgi:hypothetical protein
MHSNKVWGGGVRVLGELGTARVVWKALVCVECSYARDPDRALALPVCDHGNDAVAEDLQWGDLGNPRNPAVNVGDTQICQWFELPEQLVDVRAICPRVEREHDGFLDRVIVGAE